MFTALGIAYPDNYAHSAKICEIAQKMYSPAICAKRADPLPDPRSEVRSDQLPRLRKAHEKIASHKKIQVQRRSIRPKRDSILLLPGIYNEDQLGAYTQLTARGSKRTAQRALRSLDLAARSGVCDLYIRRLEWLHSREEQHLLDV